MKRKVENFCSYKLSMLGRQVLKQYIVNERRTMLGKIWTLAVFLLISSVLCAFCYYDSINQVTQFSEYCIDFLPVCFLAALISLVLFILLIRQGFRRCLGKNCDLFCFRRGGFKPETFYVAGSYRSNRSGWATRAFRVFLEGSKNYVLGSIRGTNMHAVNLSSECSEGTYCPCIMLDNGSVFVVPRTAVTAPRDQK